MSDHSSCPSPFVPALVGGMLGAGLAAAPRARDDADLCRQIGELTAREQARSARDQELLQLAHAGTKRDEAERAYRHAVLWLEHCNHAERFDFLFQRHGAALAHQVAVSLLAEARTESYLSALFAAISATGARSRHLAEAKERSARHLRNLRRLRWTHGMVFGAGAGFGFVLLILGWITSDAPLLAAFVAYLIIVAIAAPIVVRFQPLPEAFRRAGSGTGDPVPGGMEANLARLETAAAALEAEHSAATMDLALARETLSQALYTQRPTLLASASRHLAAPRRALVEYQSIYPPRLRCDLEALADPTLLAHLAPLLPSALDAEAGRLIEAA